MRKKKIQILLSAAAFLFSDGMGLCLPVKRRSGRLGRVERRADRNFIRQKFDKAMAAV